MTRRHGEFPLATVRKTIVMSHKNESSALFLI